MTRIYANNYAAAISAPITDTDTLLSVSHVTNLPTLTGSQYYYLSLSNGVSSEIVKVTARTSLSLTVVRGMEGSTAIAWPAGTPVEMRYTAASIVDEHGNSFANNYVADYTTTATAAGTTTLTVDSTYQQFFTGTTTQTVVLPVVSTLALGFSFLIVNKSSGNVTVQSSGANSIQVLAGGTSGIFTCIAITGTTAASWNVIYSGAGGGGGSGTVNSGTANELAYYASSGTAVSGLVSANNGVLVTDGTGVPSIATTLPNVALGTPTSVTLTNATGLPEGGLSTTDITTNDASTSKHGFLKKLNNDATYYMDGTGNWSIPAGGGGGGSPGGSNTQVQYNDAGSFAGSSGFTADSSGNVNALSLTITGDVLQLPASGSGGRPTATDGRIRYNTDLSRYEGVHSSSWTGGTQFMIDADFGTGLFLKTAANTYSSLVITQGDIIYGTGTNTAAVLSKNTNATRYLSNTGASNNPAWAQIDLSNGVTGTNPVDNGGTGRASNTAYAIIAGGTTTTDAHQSLGTGTSNQVLVSNGSSSLATFQSVMPRTCGFRAYRSGTQSLTLNTHTKIALTSESYDYDGTFDSATNYRHTPTVAGKYLYVGVIFFASPADQGQVIAEFYLNGSGATQATAAPSGTNGIVVTVVDILTMDGSTDYVELYGYRTNTGNIGSASGPYYASLSASYIGA